MGRPIRLPAVILLALVSVAIPARGQDAKPKRGYTDTPMLPGLPWRVHDGTRPLPPIVTPGTASTPDQPGKPPSDAVVLFDGHSTDAWHNGKGQPIGWTVEDGVLVVNGGTGAIVSREEFGDVQLHLEWAAPTPPSGSDQGRGNSGVLLFGRYELQVLDSYQNDTYADGQAGAIYGQYPPLVNASHPPGEWQTYDILFTAPRFKPDGTLESPAYFTVLHNGVVLQDHHNPVRYRNIWARRLDPYPAAP
jgi:hypothetical protein